MKDCILIEIREFDAEGGSRTAAFIMTKEDLRQTIKPKYRAVLEFEKLWDKLTLIPPPGIK